MSAANCLPHDVRSSCWERSETRLVGARVTPSLYSNNNNNNSSPVVFIYGVLKYLLTAVSDNYS